MRSAALTMMLAGASAAAAQGLCVHWSEPQVAGELDVSVLKEASGIAVGSGGRLYHINDGAEPTFHVTDLKGGGLQSVRIAGFRPVDIEDLAFGRCGTEDCLLLADIGDNAGRRDAVQIAMVREQERYAAQVQPLRIITARYPDAHCTADAGGGGGLRGRGSRHRVHHRIIARFGRAAGAATLP